VRRAHGHQAIVVGALAVEIHGDHRLGQPTATSPVGQRLGQQVWIHRPGRRVRVDEDRGGADIPDHVGRCREGQVRNHDLVACADGKTRRVEPGTFPVAYGVPGRVGLLRGYGNAIVPQVAAEFIKTYQEIAA